MEEPRSRTGWELHPARIRILSVPAEVMPVVIHGKEIPASLETILDYRPLTLRNERERAIFRIQDALVRGLHRISAERGFCADSHTEAGQSGRRRRRQHFPAGLFRKGGLSGPKPPVYKQMMVGVYERVFEIGAGFPGGKTRYGKASERVYRRGTLKWDISKALRSCAAWRKP